ncbi:flagellar protein FlaG [Herbaspirillum sp. ST 5-3]|uniref:flagellar protein FlaG n=1 Tax=Oxalobacteraceae TaxID=75682 RepID=UPI0010A31017|nr:flagellar protein FlaG [Herbaspirillum sp. ST 5-3]
MDIRPIGNHPHIGMAHLEKVEPGASMPAATAKPVSLPDSPTAVQHPGSVPTMEQVKQAVHEINKAMKSLSQDLEFSVDEDSNRTIVKVVDQQTKEIIRQVPTKEALEIAKALDKVQGLLIRQKA